MVRRGLKCNWWLHSYISFSFSNVLFDGIQWRALQLSSCPLGGTRGRVLFCRGHVFTAQIKKQDIGDAKLQTRERRQCEHCRKFPLFSPPRYNLPWGRGITEWWVVWQLRVSVIGTSHRALASPWLVLAWANARQRASAGGSRPGLRR